jgi:hypothetical protein
MHNTLTTRSEQGANVASRQAERKRTTHIQQKVSKGQTQQACMQARTKKSTCRCLSSITKEKQLHGVILQPLLNQLVQGRLYQLQAVNAHVLCCLNTYLS